MFKRTDFLWLLAYPFYQIIGTLRHEGAHALAAIFQGIPVKEFVFWPTWQTGGGLRWGYVVYGGTGSGWLNSAAPYILDLITFSVFFLLCTVLKIRRRWVWLNLVIVGLLSPLINSAYNFFGSGLIPNPHGGNDVQRLLALLPEALVHIAFFTCFVLYFSGLWVAFSRRRGV